MPTPGTHTVSETSTDSKGRAGIKPWFAVDEASWEMAMGFFPRPLRPELASTDLRYYENEARLGKRFPSLAVLSKRWGWGRDRVRGFIAQDDWHDPARPVPMELLRPKRTPTQRVTPQSPNESPNESGHSGATANAGYPLNSQRVANESPNESPNESAPQARVITNNHQPPTTTEPPTPLAGGEPPPSEDVNRVFNSWLSGYRAFWVARGNAQRGTRKTAPTSKERRFIAGRLKEPDTTTDDLIAIAEWTFQGQDRYAKMLRGEIAVGDSPPQPYVGIETLFKPAKFDMRRDLARDFKRSTSVAKLSFISDEAFHAWFLACGEAMVREWLPLPFLERLSRSNALFQEPTGRYATKFLQRSDDIRLEPITGTVPTWKRVVHG